MSKQVLRYSDVLQLNVASDGTIMRSLAKGQVAALRRANKIVCTAGSLWVTRERDPMDHVLERDESIEVSPREKVVVSGLPGGAFMVM